jgi:hypothetical protein
MNDEGRILRPKEVQEIRALLVKLEIHLRSAVECAVAEGDKTPREEWLRLEHRNDCADLRRLAILIKQLSTKGKS